MGCSSSRGFRGSPRVSIDESTLGEDELKALQKLRGENESHLMQFATDCVGDVFKNVEIFSDARCTMDSQNDYGQQDQTIIILDWDDTICPSSWIKSVSPVLKPPQIYKNMLTTLNYRAASLVSLADSLGKVVVVTNAKRPWIEHTCHNLLPKLTDWLKHTPVLYALEYVPPIDCSIAQADVLDALLTESKAKAMQTVLDDFYSRYPNQSWKNVISIGDALFEHEAIRSVVSNRPSRDDALKPCRCKTMKLLESLSLKGMVAQCAVVENLLTNVVGHDGDLSIDFAAHRSLLTEWYNRFGVIHHK